MWLLLCPPGINPSSGRAGPFPAAGMSGWGRGWSWHQALQLLWRRPRSGLPHAIRTRSKQEPGRQRTSTDFIDIKRTV